MSENAKQFRMRLSRSTGLTDTVISAAWPEWWSDAADASPSAQTELRFSLARKLGLDPRTLLDEDVPRFFWDGGAKYKHFSGDTENDLPAITSFGMSIARMLVKGVSESISIANIPASELRSSILRRQQFVRLQDLLALVWSVGIPTIHLRLYPLAAKRMCAMAINTNDRCAILLAKDAQYPAAIAFHLAHEIGHIALGHIDNGSAVVDMEDSTEIIDENDDEEIAADRYALELLTGNSNLIIEKVGAGRNAKNLARQVILQGSENQIEPGTLAFCYGHLTKEWATVQSAMQYIYENPIPAWTVTNKIATHQLDWSLISEENVSFLHAVMGGDLSVPRVD